jgi:uncharacterized protein (TIGR02996 family)
MSADIHALEARIRANPEDAENWKVYGDWLIAQGDRRGELIALEALAERTGDVAIRTMIGSLTAAHRDEWTPRRAQGLELGWRHGFVCTVTARDISHPYQIQWLSLLLADPQARLLTDLRLGFAEWIDEDVRTELLDELLALDVAQLRSLQAAYHAWGDAVVHALVQRPTLALTSLDLRYSGLTNAGLSELAGCERLADLRALHLQHNAFGAEGIAALASSPWLSRLETLDLRYNEIDVDGASALAQSSRLGALTTLYLHAADLDAPSVHALASSTTLQRDLVRFWRAQEQAHSP